MCTDQLCVDVRSAHRSNFIRRLHAAWQAQVALFQLFEPRTQIKSHHARERHGEVAVAVRIHRQLSGPNVFVTNHALGGNTSLALIEYEGLRMKHAPAVTYVRIDANGGGVPARVHAGLPDPFAGLHAHHVGGGQIGTAPTLGNRVALHEREYRLTGLCQTPLIGSPAHGLADTRC